MNTGYRNGIKRISRATILAALALVALLLATATPAEARGRHGHGHGNGHGHGVAHAHPSHGSHGAYHVPAYLYAPDHAAYRPWYAGRAYYRPHGHDHVSYRFPVWVGGAVVYRPYSYCGDHLFVSAAVPLPRLAIGVNLGPHVSVYGEVPLAPGGYGY